MNNDNKTDFLIPLHRNHPLFQSCLEAIIKFYYPRNIYIITSILEIEKLKICILDWNIQSTELIFLEEEFFFYSKYNLSKKNIQDNWYTYKDEQSREFGWWYQQILKLGAAIIIPQISDPFIVWDSDLIPIKKWQIYPTESLPFFHFALLQEKEKSSFNKSQYNASIYYLLKINEIFPEEEKGTFVPHHFVFYHKVIHNFIRHIEDIHNPFTSFKKIILSKINVKKKTWIEIIMSSSKDYYRFSEYKNIATFMSFYFTHLLYYHPFKEYGEKGIRIRDTEEAHKFLEKILKKNTNKNNNESISYNDFCEFVFENYKEQDRPSYIQVEHL
jgi:hypothetical protein